MAKSFTIGGFPNQSMDADADGSFLYLAVLSNFGNPQVLKLDTDLDEDATIEFDPAAGSFIGLICGNEDAGIVWAAGDFGGTDKVVKLDDELGDYWVVADPGVWPSGDAKPLFVGPSDDNWVHVGLPNDDSIWNTYFLADTGPYWVEVNPATPFDIRSWDILDRDLDQMIIGVDNDDPYWVSYFYPYVEYSPNAGASFGDITGILVDIGDESITSVIYG